jgi:adenosylcobinamide-GDP ribazoletransferase
VSSPLRALRAAFVFLTRIPVGGFPYTPDEWRWASAFFPLVGAAVGGTVGVVLRALQPVGPSGAAYLALGGSLLLTGAFHEDGLADTSDALGGGVDRAKVFAILKDSRIGAFGACALVVSLGGRASLLAHAGPRVAWALVLVGALARTVPVWQMVALPYATPESSKSRDVTRAGAAQALVASAWTLAIGVALAAGRLVEPWRAAGAVALSAFVGVVTALRFKARVGGVTGDFLGATEQLCELAGLAVIAWSPS